MNRKVIVTGAGGFIGRSICAALAECCEVWPLGRPGETGLDGIDLRDASGLDAVCKSVVPDAIVHCAGIAHQRLGRTGRDEYMTVNAKATTILADLARDANSDVHFIFLSSVSVYGEPGLPLIDELSPCTPAGFYAESKLEAERDLTALYETGRLRRLDILRLAPVYDRDWTFNLDRRVLAPGKLAYLRFGNGEQCLSALARPTLVDFITGLLGREPDEMNSPLNILNVCDAEPYSFNRIIAAFKSSGLKADRPVLPVPLWPVGLFTRAAAAIDRDRADWWRACYAKLASDLVFDNSRMLATGFRPRHSLEAVLGCQARLDID